MNLTIHPESTVTTAVCTCGTTYQLRSTKENLRFGICAACHPFYTGEQKFVDTAGRLEKFTRRFGKASKTGAIRS